MFFEAAIYYMPTIQQQSVKCLFSDKVFPILHSHLILYFWDPEQTQEKKAKSVNGGRLSSTIACPSINSYSSNDSVKFQKVNIRYENPRIHI